MSENTQPTRIEQLKQAAQSASQALIAEGVAVEQWLQFSFNGLATPPVRAVRSLLHLFSWLEVHPGTCAVCFAPDRDPFLIQPGVHWFTGLQGITTMVQFVDTRRQRHGLPSVTGVSMDGWNISLDVVLTYEVADPVQVASAREPVAALEAAAQAAILAQIETMPHETLLGTVDTLRTKGEGTGANPERGLGRLEQGILALLVSRPSLTGLHVLDVAVIRREGDRRLLNILQEEALNRVEAHQIHQTEAARSGLEKMRLEMQVQTAQAGRDVSLIQAETESQLATIKQQMRLIEARAEAEMQEIRQTQEARESERKRLAEEWRTAKELDLKSMEYQHAETLAIIQGTTQITTEAAKTGMLNSVQGNAGRIPLGGHAADDPSVAAGIQALRGFREKIAPPTTRFLPTLPAVSPEAGGYGGRGARLQAEEIRLERIPNTEYEMLIRHGEIAGARVWFTAGATPVFKQLQIEMACSETYPADPPVFVISHFDQKTDYTPSTWTPALFLADVVREFMVDWVSRSVPTDGVVHENGHETLEHE